MNAFESAKTVEQRSLEILRPFIQQRAYNGRFVITSKGPLAREIQCAAGDVFFNSDCETVYSIEIKAEESNRYGNFFFETWSNRSRFKLGWIYTLSADLLLYHFIDDDMLFKIPFQKLKRWAFHSGRIYDFEERRQSKYEQMNDTWGRCVPISVIIEELGLNEAFAPSINRIIVLKGAE